MIDRDRPTPPDPMPAVRRQEAPGRADAEDAQRLIREAASAAARRTAAVPPPLPPRAQERKQTPASGGIEAQGKPSTVEIAEAPPASLPPTRTAWLKLAFKLGAAVVGLIGAITTLLAIRANTAIEPKVEAQETRIDTGKVTADDHAARLAKLEAYARGEAKRRECVERQLRDAIARGTGHVLPSLPSGGVGWAEQNKPKAQPRTVWVTPTWFTTEVCDPAPAPP